MRARPTSWRVRALLEPLVAEMAAGRATPEADIAAIETATRNAVDAKEPASWSIGIAARSPAIFRAAGNAALLDWYEAIEKQCPAYVAAGAARSYYLRSRPQSWRPARP